MEIVFFTVHLLLFYLQLCSSAHASDNGSFNDEQALLALKNSITYDPYNVLSSWDSNTNVCNWTGISCNRLMRVSTIDLESEGLEGHISPFLGNLSYLKSLNVSYNNFHGVIPEIGHKLSNLQELRLAGNQLSGRIPTSLGNCSKLILLDLSLNSLTGTVPLQLGKLSSLQRLLLSDNLLTSSRNLPFLRALANCSALQTLYLGNNSLVGELSPYVGKLSTKLSVLSLEQNFIGGSIPQEIGNLTSLTLINFTVNAFTGFIPSTLGQIQMLERLYLGQNKLQGPIPSEIVALKHLGLLSLSFNLLSGQIPETIGNLSQLRRLQLDNNQFEGGIPVNLGKCLKLELVDLSHNNLNGKIPPEIAGLQNLQFYFSLSGNSLQGSLPAEIGKMASVQGIDLSGNQLSGAIPRAIGSCVALEYLNLSHNMFEGPIIDSVFNLKNLEALDLSYNNLSGMIPDSLQNLTMLSFLNVSFNLLRGEVPKTGLFANLTASSFRGNPGLCGQWIFSLSACQNAGSSGEVLFKYIASAISSLVAYCLYVLFLYKYFFGKEDVELPMEFPHPRISYKELSTATNGFGKGNLLGVGSVGSVYKGVLDNGTLIAVKALNLENEAAHKSFNIECQVLGKTRHRNIIKITTSCSNLDFKGLVFEFMSNGNLEKYLHCDAGKCNIGGVCKMNLQTRLQIAMDVARGLAYLHHDCSIQVVHCDLKPDNVLLDFYMTAHVADFGNAYILSENSMHSSSSSTLKGAPGYIAPEYGIGARISTKGDVYSYGILLLEMLTRKRPTDQMFVDGLSLRTWVSMAFPERISEVVDNSLLLCNGAVTDATCNCLIQLIRVALLCSKDSPKDRPSMAEVVELLECIEEMFEGCRLDSKYQSDLYQMISSKRWAGDFVKVVKGQSTSTLQSTS
ncbi:putative leucine-rich repeat receptor-like serine/threonine-protein kinase At2g24130 isoform X2 [Cryptomeria japonica]|uniref:putative leucine-rich repeat receptor-like serine/threonine-protein kinase At2g24130 isoform X2 n=1 Tax=Cryptomeria japonica TaxID=3369 RepID=UPI0027DA98B6|nr:putative leucine-rich repeat receptor-like serine/threonine-protein kinase At2g24130 isoform X2 [Cryptomeria japonica]